MFSIADGLPRLCDAVPRRTVLRAGTLAALGMSLPGWRRAASAGGTSSGRARSCIVLFLMGGPPQHSMWDPKPDAPAEVRGQIGPISTVVPGIQIGELLPATARHMDQIALLRAVVTGDSAHSSSGYYMLTGVPHSPKQVENANPGPPNDHPAISAVVQSLSRSRSQMPTAVRLPMHIFNTDGSIWPGQDSGWLGHAADPWLFRCEPASAQFSVPQFRLPADVTLERLDERRTLLEQIESHLRELDRENKLRTFSAQQQQAFDLLGSAAARAACDLSRESDEARARYGRGQFGQSVLLARRLTESGVGFVHVNWFRGPDEPKMNPCWDSHTDETNRLKNVLVPPFDQALAALVTDLKERGRLGETVVAVIAEFGRSPRFNPAAGRDHWGQVFSIALMGGGIRGGQVVGSTDPQGGQPLDRIVTPEDVTATIFHLLGYEPHTEIHDRFGRPHPISRGQVISELI